MAVHPDGARNWNGHEIAPRRETVERCWAHWMVASDDGAQQGGRSDDGAHQGGRFDHHLLKRCNLQVVEGLLRTLAAG